MSDTPEATLPSTSSPKAESPAPNLLESAELSLAPAEVSSPSPVQPQDESEEKQIYDLQQFIKGQTDGTASLSNIVPSSSTYSGGETYQKPLPIRIFEGIIKFLLGLFGVKFNSPTPQPT